MAPRSTELRISRAEIYFYVFCHYLLVARGQEKLLNIQATRLRENAQGSPRVKATTILKSADDARKGERGRVAASSVKIRLQ